MKYRLIPAIIILAIVFTLNFSPVRGAVIKLDIADLTARSDRIVIGDVVEITSFWNEDHTLIKSRIVVDIDDYLTGDGSGREILKMSGGTVDDLTLRVSVLPEFEIGDRVLLFLGNSEIGLIGSFQGAYLTDGNQVAMMAAGCRQIFSETIQPLDSLISAIEQGLPPGTSLPEVSPYDGDFEFPIGAPLYALCGRDWTYQSNPMGEDYKINANCQDGPAGNANSQRTQIQYGADAWNGAGADFEFTYGGTSSQNYVSYDQTNLVYFDTSPPDGGGYLAATYMWFSGGNMTECDFVYDDLHWTWWNGSGGCYGYFDIRGVAAHEFGHFLCLDHSSYSSATMYYAVGACQTHQRSLHFDDINGIIAIYGDGEVDITPPSPNPMTFDSSPAAATAASIAMIATAASDNSLPIEYYFDFISGGPGGSDRGWGVSRSYTNGGLTPNTEYSYRCAARDNSSPPNETNYSSVAGDFTFADIPGAPLLSNITYTTIDLAVDPNDNPANTDFAVLCTTTDPTWNNMFLNDAGDPSPSEVWQTVDLWGTTTVRGLSPGTEYTFRVKALNENNIETDYGVRGSETTLPEQVVPALSEWGMIILTLLLMTFGTVVIIKRRQRTLTV